MAPTSKAARARTGSAIRLRPCEPRNLIIVPTFRAQGGADSTSNEGYPRTRFRKSFGLERPGNGILDAARDPGGGGITPDAVFDSAGACEKRSGCGPGGGTRVPRLKR